VYDLGPYLCRDRCIPHMARGRNVTVMVGKPWVKFQCQG